MADAIAPANIRTVYETLARRFGSYRKTSQSTSAARMISRTASVIPNTNAQALNSSTVALLAVAKAK